MEPGTPLVVAAARYGSREDAVKDFHIVWGAKREGRFDHMSVAILSKDETGELEVERHNSTTRHAAWGGAVLGAALVLVAPPAGVAAVAAGGAALAGAGALVGRFHRALSGEQVAELGSVLRSGESGLLVVAVNRKGAEIEPLLANAQRARVIETTAGDLDAAFQGELEKAGRRSA